MSFAFAFCLLSSRRVSARFLLQYPARHSTNPSGSTDEYPSESPGADVRLDDLVGRCDPGPSAAPGRAPRARGGGAVHRAPTAAVDGQPASEGAGRRRLAGGAFRGNEPLLSAGGNAARPGGASAVGAAARADGAGRVAEQDERRLATVLSGRRTRSQAFFGSAAGQWTSSAAMYGDASTCRPRRPSRRGWVVGDLGCGTARSPRRWRRSCGR